MTSKLKYLVICVDRDNDFGDKAGIASPVIGLEKCIDAGLKLADALLVENAESEGAYQYINYIVVNKGDEDKDSIKALIKAVQSDEVKEYLEKNYGDSVVVAFTDPNAK